MPFLRFSRDKRGYESTFLLQNVRQHGKVRSQVLYWFRTPPNVKVGRAVLDEEAIRLIEAANPDIDFDWAKVLKAKPLPPAVDEVDGRRRRPARDRPVTAGPARGGRRRRPEALRPAEPVIEAQPLGDDVDEPVTATEHGDADERGSDRDGSLERAADRVHPVEGLVGAEGHARLQAQYAELLARISSRVRDADRRTQLRDEAASLDPDSWVTVEDAKTAIETFDARMHEFRSKLGRRARRSRRGGRGRRGKGGASAPETAAGGPAGGDIPPLPPSDDTP